MQERGLRRDPTAGTGAIELTAASRCDLPW